MTPRQKLDIERARKAGVTKRQILAAIVSRHLDVDEAIWLQYHPDAWIEKLIFKHGLSFTDARRFAQIKNRFGLGHCQTLRLLRGEMTPAETSRVVTQYMARMQEETGQPIPAELLCLVHPPKSSDRDGDMFDRGSRMSGSYGSAQ